METSQPFDYLRRAWPVHIHSSLRSLLSICLEEASNSHEQSLAGQLKLLLVQIASYPLAPSELLDLLSDSKDSNLLIRIAENPQARAAILSKLSVHPDPNVRAAVAESKELSIELINALANDQSTDVRFCLAENVALPNEVLESLSSDENPYVAHRAACTLARICSTGGNNIAPSALIGRYEESVAC